ncbi:Serine/threonine-protein kinase KIC1 [Penicillium rolfsii]|nr:Serine/threonine-protein kinase KIC1 [Penicillium rolfsii]
MDHRGSRFLDPSSAMAAITRHKAEAIKLAREQGTAVKEMCRRAKTDVPPYEFEELIGKGAYGRVYKGRQIPSGRLVAIKVLDIDSLDYKSLRDFRDESIKDFIHETKVMKQVKDSGAKNINELIEAISIHSQLWLVCEYCPGGSVRTLMRATNDKLDEKYIIPIARELAVGLHAIHEAGIIHRDVKAANILIHEEGRLEICDFGVAGVLQSQRDKRSTWIGTPHWMPPEMFTTRGEAHKYGSEIDVWAYGCTLFEFVTGNPPNSGLRERMQIGRQLNRNTPKLDSEDYSEGLKDLIAFALDSNPATRPTMADILAHPYIAGTEEEYPTSSVSELVRIYYQWSQRGGQRISLFHPGGAAAAELPGTEEVEDDWNFSTTDGFERRFSVIDLDQIAASLAEMEEAISPTTPLPENDSNEDISDIDMDPQQKANFDERVRRGAAAMEGLFDEEKPSYKYETKNDFVPIQPPQPTSDLPLRTETDRSSVTSTFIDIDIGSFDSSHYAAGAPSAQPFQLANADTIRANRSSLRTHRNSNENSSQSSNSDMEGGDSQDESFQPASGPRPPTMDWKFPGFMLPEAETAKEAPEEAPAPAPAPVSESMDEKFFQAEKRATMEWTFPVMSNQGDDTTANDAAERHDTLRAPIVPAPRQSAEEPVISRPSTSASHTSTISDSDYDPFRFDRPATPPGISPQPLSSFNSEFPTLTESTDDESESAGVLDGPGPDEEEEHPLWNEHHDVVSEDDVPPLPTAIPVHGSPGGTAPSVSEPGSPIYEEPLQTARRDVMSKASTLRDSEWDAISFPAVLPPSMESLMEGADDATITAELDRLLGDFLGALSATGEALARIVPEDHWTEDSAYAVEKDQ